MSLVQTNAIREILEDAAQRLAAMPTVGFPQPAIAALNRAQGFITRALAAVSRLEEKLAKDKADTGGDTNT